MLCVSLSVDNLNLKIQSGGTVGSFRHYTSLNHRRKQSSKKSLLELESKIPKLEAGIVPLEITTSGLLPGAIDHSSKIQCY